MIRFLPCLLLILSLSILHAQEGSSDSTIIAIVDDETITHMEVSAEVEVRAQKYMKASGGLTETAYRSLKSEIWDKVIDDLIDSQLLYNYAEKMGIVVMEDEVNKLILEWGKSSGLESLSKIEEFLKQHGLTMGTFRSNQRRDLMQRKLISRIYSNFQITSPDEIREYYEKNKDRYTVGGEVQLRQIILFPNNKRRYKSPKQAEESAERILKEIQSGKDFAATARRSSEMYRETDGIDPITNLMDHPKEIIEAVKEMKIGEVSKVISTQDSLRIIRLEKFVPGDPQTLEEVESSIQHELSMDRNRERLNKLIENLRKKSYIRIINK